MNIRLGRVRTGQGGHRGRARLRPMVAAAALAAAVTGLPILAGTAAATPATPGTVITTEATSFGRSLAVGSGPFAGFTLYYITSDHGTTFGCTTADTKLPEGSIHCTGPSAAPDAEWPAITTTGAPVAAGGVAQKLLGTVTRAGIGQQVTYDGHPLYLFDQGPGQVTGEDWDEPSIPPWHGIWYLVAPNGKARAWPGTLTTMRIGKKKVLATPMMTLVGWEDFPVYSFSKDTPHHSQCTRACAIAWPPVLTGGTPGVSKGLFEGKVGELSRWEGSQVRYAGRPLYLFGDEGIAPGATGGLSPTGSGNGAHVDGGTFRLVPA